MFIIIPLFAYCLHLILFKVIRLNFILPARYDHRSLKPKLVKIRKALHENVILNDVIHHKILKDIVHCPSTYVRLTQ